MLKQLFKNTEVWIAPIIIAVVVGFITFCLLSAFLSPTENTHNLPVALVNGDEGVTAGTQTMNFGKEISNRLTAPQPTDLLKWTVLDSRESALQGVRQNKYYAAVIIPADYSKSLMLIAGQKATQPAKIEILNNPVSPTFGGQLATNVIQNIVGNISKATGEQLAAQVQKSGVALALPSATLLDNPVQISSVAVATIGDHSGRGINVFFLTIILTIAGLMSALMPNMLIQRTLEERRQQNETVSAWAIFGARVFFYTLASMASVGGVLLTALALNMDVADWFSLSLFTSLYVLAISWLTLLCQMVFKRGAIPFTALVLLLLSIPASGALYPLESLPAVWQWLYAVVPMRFMVDGMRSVLFLNNEMENGLGTAIIALSSYAIGALLIAGTIAWVMRLNTANKTNQSKVSEPISV
jgi:YhgE/Pip-like protein